MVEAASDAATKGKRMADAGEGLIDAQNRIQERMDEREEERARRASHQADQ